MEESGGVSIKHAHFPEYAVTSSRACSGANKFSRPQGQELSKMTIAIDGAGTKVEAETCQGTDL
jgi:hypothetical protein